MDVEEQNQTAGICLITVVSSGDALPCTKVGCHLSSYYFSRGLNVRATVAQKAISMNGIEASADWNFCRHTMWKYYNFCPRCPLPFYITFVHFFFLNFVGNHLSCYRVTRGVIFIKSQGRERVQNPIVKLCCHIIKKYDLCLWCIAHWDIAVAFF